jgi:zinc protease
VFHGDWSRLFDAPARIAAVSGEELRAVAAEILDDRHRTVGVLVPSEERPDADRHAARASSGT